MKCEKLLIYIGTIDSSKRKDIALYICLRIV